MIDHLDLDEKPEEITIYFDTNTLNAFYVLPSMFRLTKQDCGKFKPSTDRVRSVIENCLSILLKEKLVLRQEKIPIRKLEDLEIIDIKVVSKKNLYGSGIDIVYRNRSLSQNHIELLNFDEHAMPMKLDRSTSFIIDCIIDQFIEKFII